MEVVVCLLQNKLENSKDRQKLIGNTSLTISRVNQVQGRIEMGIYFSQLHQNEARNHATHAR